MGTPTTPSRLYRAADGRLYLRSKKPMVVGIEGLEEWAAMDHRGDVELHHAFWWDAMTVCTPEEERAFRDLPAVSTAIALQRTIVCTRGRRRPRCKVPHCVNDGAILCDFPVTRADRPHDWNCPALQQALLGEHPKCECPTGTCSFPLCMKHRRKTTRGDVCPAHANQPWPS